MTQRSEQKRLFLHPDKVKLRCKSLRKTQNQQSKAQATPLLLSRLGLAITNCTSPQKSEIPRNKVSTTMLSFRNHESNPDLETNT